MKRIPVMEDDALPNFGSRPGIFFRSRGQCRRTAGLPENIGPDSKDAGPAGTNRGQPGNRRKP